MTTDGRVCAHGIEVSTSSYPYGGLVTSIEQREDREKTWTNQQKPHGNGLHTGSRTPEVRRVPAEALRSWQELGDFRLLPLWAGEHMHTPLSVPGVLISDELCEHAQFNGAALPLLCLRGLSALIARNPCVSSAACFTTCFSLNLLQPIWAAATRRHPHCGHIAKQRTSPGQEQLD